MRTTLKLFCTINISSFLSPFIVHCSRLSTCMVIQCDYFSYFFAERFPEDSCFVGSYRSPSRGLHRKHSCLGITHSSQKQ